MKKTFLPRLQLFELMDFPWFPGWLRRYSTDVLLFSWRHFAPREEITRQLSSLVEPPSEGTLVDLCSGSGGFVTTLFEDLRQRSRRDLSLILTDLFPNRELEVKEGVRYWPEPVDVRAIDGRLTGVRTLFGSFHHFAPQQAREILLDAKRSGQPIAIYELTQRSVSYLFLIVLNSLFGTLLFTPFYRPFSWPRLLFTYLIPLIPLTLLFDGIVSVLRSYSEEEMLALAEDKSDDGYEWKSGVHGSMPPAIVYLTGVPRRKNDLSTNRKERCKDG